MNITRQQKKILFVITKSNWGGAQRYVHDLATNITKSDFTILVALGGEGELKKRLEAAGVRTLSLPGLGRDIKILRDIRVFINLFKIFRAEKPDVIHLNSSKIGGLGAMAGRMYLVSSILYLVYLKIIKGKKAVTIQNIRPNGHSSGRTKIVFTIHGLPHLEPRPYWQRQIIKLLTWFTILLSHKVITVCEHDRLKIANWPLVGSKVETIFNGIELDAHYDREIAQSHLAKMSNFQSIFKQFSNGQFTIGVIAELHPNKGLHYLLESLAILRLKTTDYGLSTIIIGEGEDRPILEHLIERHGLTEHILLLGHVPDASRYLKAFDMFVLPSIKEGLPYVLLEAAQAKVPILATYTGGIQDLVRHRRTGHLVRPGDSDALADAIFQLMMRREKREIMAYNMHQHVNKNHTLEGMVEKTLDTYFL
jgi:glycosyltransferase involved in cell wall biosynthesis